MIKKYFKYYIIELNNILGVLKILDLKNEIDNQKFKKLIFEIRTNILRDRRIVIDNDIDRIDFRFFNDVDEEYQDFYYSTNDILMELFCIFEMEDSEEIENSLNNLISKLQGKIL